MNMTMQLEQPPYEYPYAKKQVELWLDVGIKIHLMWNPGFPDHALGFEVGRDSMGKEYAYVYILYRSDDVGWRCEVTTRYPNWIHPISGWIARKTMEISVSRETAVGMWNEARETGWREWRKPWEVSEEKEG